ncbi:MAG: TolC family protein [Candidatus Solibacter usitatus]|nr:TolC family protein [Candidatus Solibacter usitatus]
MRHVLALLVLALAAQAEPHTLTLKQAVELALRQNPDLVLARLDEQKTAYEVQAVKEPLLPRVFVGSGLAYTSGMPMSIDGASPSVIQAKAVRSIYNAQQGYRVAGARETSRAAALGVAALREEIALRTASLFLDLERTVRARQIAARQTEHLQRVEASVRLRVEEGRELPIEARRAAVNLAHSRRREEALASSQAALSRSLALVLALSPADPISPAAEPRDLPNLPADLPGSVAEALSDNREIRKLEADLAAKNLAVRGHRAARLPKIDLVAQYGLLARFNNYEDYFNSFQRHNGQVGVSIQVPIFASPADEARAAQAEIEARRIRFQINELRSRIEANTRNAWQKVHDAESAREVARLDLDLAREQVSLLLAQMEEGRATMKQLEEARFQEQERWLGLYDAGYQLELARFEILRHTNALVAALR